MIAFITRVSHLTPLLEGLCYSNPCRNEFFFSEFLPESNRRPRNKQSRALTNWASVTSSRILGKIHGKHFLLLCTGAHARVHVHFCGKCGMHSISCCWLPCKCRCVCKQVFRHQHTHLRTRSLQGVHMRSCMRSFFIQRWGTWLDWFS